MTNNIHRKTPRGPLISSREIFSKRDLEEGPANPQKMFSDAVARVTLDLMNRVGYQHKLTITIEPLKSEHPQSPGFMIAAKMRRP